ncbi:site-specific integrase [Pseudomonas sp. X10]
MINSHSGIDAQQVFRSRDGWEFNACGRTWRLNKNTTVCLGWVDNLAIDIKNSFLATLRFYSIYSSAAHARNISDRAKRFFEFTRGKLDTSSLLAYRASLDASKEHYLGGLKGFFITWYEQGHPGISEEFFKTLNAWVLKGNEVGRAVLQMDSLKGPLTDIEMQGVLDGVIACYSKSRLPLEEFSLILTLVHTGRRPVQMVALKIKDLLLAEKNGIAAYSINFPRAKQRHAPWRSTFNTCAIDEDLWLILKLQAVETVKRLQDIVGFSLSDSVIKEVPLFADFGDLSQGISEKALLRLLQFDYLHASANVCGTALARFSEIHCVLSERTGEPLSLSPRRFRSTLGTNVARQGYGVSIVAEVLDHSNIRSAGYYIKSLSDIVARIDKAVAQQLAPLAQAFQGVLVTTEKEAVRGGDASSRISNGRVNVGTCGNYGFCGALAPIACYTCIHFQPWVDGPHEEVLDELLAGSDRVWEVTKDVKIASVNARLILAVTEVVQRCAQAKRATYDG